MHIDNQRKLSRQELKSLQKIANKKRGCNVADHLKKPLKLTKMTHKFYTAPITKFWFFLVGFLLVKFKVFISGHLFRLFKIGICNLLQK